MECFNIFLRDDTFDIKFHPEKLNKNHFIFMSSRVAQLFIDERLTNIQSTRATASSEVTIAEIRCVLIFWEFLIIFFYQNKQRTTYGRWRERDWEAKRSFLIFINPTSHTYEMSGWWWSGSWNSIFLLVFWIIFHSAVVTICHFAIWWYLLGAFFWEAIFLSYCLFFLKKIFSQEIVR